MSNLITTAATSALSKLNPISAVGSVIDSVGGLAKIFVGDKAAKETNIHDEQIAAYSAEANEALAQQRESRTWWDSLVDGLNRLPRPFMAFMAIGVLLWCPISPVSFSVAMTAYQLVPQWLALVIAQIFAIFCGGRMLSDHFEMKANDPTRVAQVLAQMRELKGMQTAKAVEVPGVDVYKTTKSISEKAYKEQMADNAKPLSLEAIVEWNKRKGN